MTVVDWSVYVKECDVKIKGREFETTTTRKLSVRSIFHFSRFKIGLKTQIKLAMYQLVLL